MNNAVLENTNTVKIWGKHEMNWTKFKVHNGIKFHIDQSDTLVASLHISSMQSICTSGATLCFCTKKMASLGTIHRPLCSSDMHRSPHTSVRMLPSAQRGGRNLKDLSSMFQQLWNTSDFQLPANFSKSPLFAKISRKHGLYTNWHTWSLITTGKNNTDITLPISILVV